jgi:hypothetical protein
MMQKLFDKVETGAIVIIAGEYTPVDQKNHEVSDELVFMTPGETAPDLGDDSFKWKLVEMFDGAS